MPIRASTKPIDMAVLMGEDKAGPSGGGGLLLESDISGDSFLLLETNDYILLEE